MHYSSHPRSSVSTSFPRFLGLFSASVPSLCPPYLLVLVTEFAGDLLHCDNYCGENRRVKLPVSQLF